MFLSVSRSVKESEYSRSKSAVTPVPVDVLLSHTRLSQDLPKVVVLITLTLSEYLNSRMTKLRKYSLFSVFNLVSLQKLCFDSTTNVEYIF